MADTLSLTTKYQLTLPELTTQLEAADVNYYDLSTPDITDVAYDSLARQYFNRTGFKWIRQGNLGDIRHSRLMGTQDKVRSGDETRTELGASTLCLWTPKIDGAGFELAYAATPKGLRFARGLSRGKRPGDGFSYGEDMTASLRHVPGLPQALEGSDPEVVRGEVYMPKKLLAVANVQRVADGEKPFDNTRNAVGGIIRKGDPRYLAFLRFVAYKAFDPLVPQHEDESFDTETAMFAWLASQGFEIPPSNLETNDNLTEEGLEAWVKTLDLPYEIDGVVITVDSWATQRQLGVGSEFPKFSRAYKFEDALIEGVVKGYHHAATRTGRIVSRYEIEPVVIDGATVRFATGNNWAWMKDRYALPGDIVAMRRCNGVIPRLEKVLKPNHGDLRMADVRPLVCPACQGPVTENHVDLLCANEDCSARLPALLEYACNKKNLDVDGMGESLADALCETGVVKLLPELFTLEVVHLENLQLGLSGVTFGRKRAETLVANLARARNKSWAAVLHSLGCPGLGAPECREIAARYSLDVLLDLSGNTPTRLKDELVALKGVGATTADTFIAWLDKNRGWLMSMFGLGFNLAAMGVAEPTGGTLAGLSFVITGSHSVPRPKLEELVVANGGTISSAVSKKTSYLVAGSDAGSKLEKATKAGVPVIDEQGLRGLITG